MADLDQDLSACAGLLSRGDPARLRAVMAAPPDLRRMLLPLYAFNLEVARAPWLTKEPLIAEMRLQWWRDALDEIAGDGAARRHEVVAPLAAVLDAEGARALDDLVETRRADIEGQPPATEDALADYIDRTAGTLLWTAARLAGATDEAPVRAAGLAQGIAAWLGAVPDLVARGRNPLPPGEPHDVIRALATRGLAALAEARAARLPKPARPVLLVLSDTGTDLRAHAAHPGQAPALNPFVSRARLTWRALIG